MREVMAVIIVLCAGAAAHADTVVLRNGRELHGVLISERADVVRLRTEDGVITIPRADIASFTAGPVAPSPRPASTPREDRPAPAPGSPVGLERQAWTWADGLSSERIAELTPVRDRLLEELAKLGPTPEERLRALTTTPEERARLGELIQRFGWRQHQGSAPLQRQNARNAVVACGVKALPSLVESLSSDGQWIRRISAQAVEGIARAPGEVSAEDARWLMVHLDLPSRLGALLEHEGEVDSPFIRAEAASAIGAVTGHELGWPGGITAPARTDDELAACRRWTTWWAAEKVRWREEQEQRARAREALVRKLALVREGRVPE